MTKKRKEEASLFKGFDVQSNAQNPGDAQPSMIIITNYSLESNGKPGNFDYGAWKS
jgi:hypothetical protein